MHASWGANCWRLSVCCGLLLSAQFIVQADEFTYLDEQRQTITIQARLAGSGQGFQVLERWDGQLQLVPAGAILNRVNTGDPEPIDAAGMRERLMARFGEEQLRFETRPGIVVAVVLHSGLDRAAEGRCTTFLKKAATFMTNVDAVFLRFARQMKFPLRDPRYPLVLLIFETDQDFEAYTHEATGGRTLSAANIVGFYSLLTNWLAVRMSGCDSFEVPLHEAIHQQMYNRVLQRLAPIPKWFDEGIATGFEANGQNINVNPLQVNARYARQAQRLSGQVDWRDIIRDDSAYNADVLAGDAYTLAWCLHWMLAAERKEGYQQFVQQLAELPPLGDQPAGERVAQFEQAFGTTILKLQEQFPKALGEAIRRQKTNLNDPFPPGYVEAQQQLGAVQLRAISTNGVTRVDGRLRNISPLRSMTFYLTFESEFGAYADWLFPDVKPGQTVNVPEQIPLKVIPGQPGGYSSRFRIYIRSTPSDSAADREWKSGQVPGPVGGGR